MSHIRKCKLQIKNPDATLLKKSVELVAKEMGLETVTTLARYNGSEPQSVLLGVKGKGAAYGLGVRIVNGEIEALGDDWQQSLKLETFQSKVQQAYKVNAYQRQLLGQGFGTQIAYKQEEKQYVLQASKM